jgi:hypothetical protein
MMPPGGMPGMMPQPAPPDPIQLLIAALRQQMSAPPAGANPYAAYVAQNGLLGG